MEDLFEGIKFKRKATSNMLKFADIIAEALDIEPCDSEDFDEVHAFIAVHESDYYDARWAYNDYTEDDDKYIGGYTL